MATYAIGDIQGCYNPLRRLLDRLQFDPAKDQLWFAGDLINRGPQSLETLRFIMSLGNSARSVLGNHDCHFLAIAHGHHTPYKADTFSDILNADDADELIQWLRKQPFLHEDKGLGYSMVHAGIPPQWSMADARRYARELETVFQGDQLDGFLAAMYSNQPDYWDDDLAGNDRLRFIINSFTRLRYCDAQGRLNLKDKGALGTQTKGLVPWFEAPNRKTTRDKILFGHWSTLGFYTKNNATCLDSGCLWGGSLTALKLGDHEERISESCDCFVTPGL
ncbi:MAG: symmetrical bis(5'-nucleosyl)-tetraphosphatase [Cycloclasticus sp.]